MGTVTKRWLNLVFLKKNSGAFPPSLRIRFPWIHNLTFKINFLLLFSFLTLQIPGIKYPRYPSLPLNSYLGHCFIKPGFETQVSKEEIQHPSLHWNWNRVGIHPFKLLLTSTNLCQTGFLRWPQKFDFNFVKFKSSEIFLIFLWPS